MSRPKPAIYQASGDLYDCHMHGVLFRPPHRATLEHTFPLCGVSRGERDASQLHPSDPRHIHDRN